MLLLVLKELEQGSSLLLLGQVFEGALDGVLAVVVAVEADAEAGMELGTFEATVMSGKRFGLNTHQSYSPFTDLALLHR